MTIRVRNRDTGVLPNCDVWLIEKSPSGFCCLMYGILTRKHALELARKLGLPVEDDDAKAYR